MMRTPFALKLVSIGVLLLPAASVLAQTDFEKAIKQYDGETVKGYIQPFTDLFGANMQSGYYHSAEIPKEGFHISLDFIVMGTLVGDQQRSYLAPTPPGFSPTSFKTATIFGDKGTVVQHATIPGLAYKGSDGIINSNVLSLVVPQLTLGSLQGTELSVRFVPIPRLSGEKFPSATLWAVGVRHSISQYFPGSPAELAIGGFYNRFTLGEYIDFKGYTVGMQASRRFAFVVFYGGLSYESGVMNLTYQTTDPQQPPTVDVSLDAANNIRFTVGAGLDFQVFQLYGDASFGEVTTITLGIGFSN